MKQLNCSTSVTSVKENILQEGHCVRNRWHIIKKIGQGAFGEVYHCRDKKDDSEVAIKIVSKEKDKSSSNAAIQILKLEVSVLRALQGQCFFPRFKAFGKTMRFDYLAMELLGPSLSELRRRQPHRKFSLSTSLRLGEMMLRCIQALHKTGYVHRDIKPSNFVMGIGKNSRKVYLLDFGLSRQYLLENGELRPARPKASFQGTPRYASINVLNHREAGRQDDLISLFYVLSEFTFQELPWKNFRELTDVAYAKETFDHQLLVSEFPDDFQDYFSHISDLTYVDEPNYDMLLSLFDRTLKRRGVKETDPLDFEVDELTPFVNIQIEEHPQSARTQSDVHVVSCELDHPVIAEERLDNMNHHISSTQQIGGSCVLEESSEKKISKNISNLSINSNNLYSSCKDTGFSISPNGNQTFASVNTDIESPVSNDPKNKLLFQSITEPKKALPSQHNESIDSLLKESVTVGRNPTDNSQLTLKPFPKLAPQVIKQINLAIPLCSKANKPEKKRHSVRRSVSQPSRTRASLTVVQNVLSAPRRAQQGLPRCWSCPTISLFIRSDLKPPLKQQASFEENVYEVDVMRNVAAARKSIEDFVQFGWRRNSLPSVLDSKIPNGPFANAASEQELTKRNTRDGTNLESNRVKCDTSCMQDKNNSASTSLTKVKKSLSDSNVVGYRKSKYLQRDRSNTPVNSNKLTQLMSDDQRSTTHEISTCVSPNYSLSKSPTFKNNVESNYITNYISQESSNEQEKYTTTDNNTLTNNRKEVANYVKDDLKNINTKQDKNLPKENPMTIEGKDMLDYTKHKETDIPCQNNDRSHMLETSKTDKIPMNSNIESCVDIEESSLQKKKDEASVNNNAITSESVNEFFNSISETVRQNSEDTSLKVSQSKENVVLTTTNSSDTHLELQTNEQDTSGCCSNKSLTGFENNISHSLEERISQINIPEVVINQASESSISESSNRLSLQGNKMETEENNASQNLSCSDEVDQIPQSKEVISLTSTPSNKAHLQGKSNDQEINGSCKASSEKSLTRIKNNLLHSLENQNSQLNIPEVVIHNASESSISESLKSLSKNKIDFSENGPSQKLSLSEVDQSSLQSDEFISPQVFHSHNDCINESNNSSSSFQKSNDPLQLLEEENMQLNVPEASENSSVPEMVVSEPRNKISKNGSNIITERSENITSEPKSLSKESFALDSNKCNGTFDSFQKNPDSIPRNSKSCENSTKPSYSVSSLSAKGNNYNNSLLEENGQLTASEAVINNSLGESNVSNSNGLLNSLSENVNRSTENQHLSTKAVSKEPISLYSNNPKETVNSMKKNLCFPMSNSNKQHANLNRKNSNETSKTGGPFISVKPKDLQLCEPILNTSLCASNNKLSKSTSVKANVSEQILNTLISENSISESNKKLCKSKSVNSIDFKENLTPLKASFSKEKVASKSRDCNETDRSFLNNDTILSDMAESDKKNMASNSCVSPNIKESLDNLQDYSSDTIVPENNASETTYNIFKSESNSAIESTENITPRNSRRQRQNSDSKYAKDEKDLNLNFTRRRHRPVSQIYEETDQFSDPSASILQSPSENSVYDLLQPPPGDPPPDHCLPSRRMRYRRSLTLTSSS